ncbi:hypothetical protein ONZ45_g12341 [Pleurotus djamor]|nr:hypothetical protein ONZ45_g12341 [Pleurotus djamor]
MTFYDTWNIGDHIIHPRLDDPTNQEAPHGTYHELIKIRTHLSLVLKIKSTYLPTFGHPTRLDEFRHNIDVCKASISTPVQLFYAWRLHSLQASKRLTYSIYGFSVISLSMYTVYPSSSLLFESPPVSSYLTHMLPPLEVSAVITAVTSPRGIPPVVHDYESRKTVHTGPQGKLLAPTLIWLCSSALADLLVTGGISYILLRSKTGFRRTDSKVSKIIQLTLETGLLTSTCILLEIVLFLLQQTGIIGGFRGINYDDSAYYMIPDLILSKLYANMLLATLNARAQWRATSGSASASIEI